jgi:hypothetical protein
MTLKQGFPTIFIWFTGPELGLMNNVEAALALIYYNDCAIVIYMHNEKLV